MQKRFIERMAYRKVKEETINMLLTITKLLNENNYEELKKYITFSPAGDCMGTENYIIKFIEDNKNDEHSGFGDLIQMLSMKYNNNDLGFHW